jgi:uncharacterized protein (TIGR02118 family)
MVIFRTPLDAEAFDRHYVEVHAPLVHAMPGLQKYEVSSGPVGLLVGDFRAHLVVTLHFQDAAAIRNAFRSPEGRAAAADRLVLAPDDSDVLMLQFDTREL